MTGSGTTGSETSVELGNGRTMAAYLARPPAGERPAPGLLLLYEAMGLTADIRRHADRFAAHGFVTLVPDVLAVRSGPRPLCVLGALASIKRGKGPEFAALDKAREHLVGLAGVDSRRLGVVGFCLGGGFAVLLASRGGFRVAAPFYGDVPKDESLLARACPVVASFGERDRRFLPAAGRLRRGLAAAGVPHDVRVYPGAGHSFMNGHTGFFAEQVLPRVGMPVAYDEPAAEDSWRRTLDFFAHHLETP